MNEQTIEEIIANNPYAYAALYGVYSTLLELLDGQLRISRKYHYGHARKRDIQRLIDRFNEIEAIRNAAIARLEVQANDNQTS
jgi:hypothetical protein